MYRFLRGSAALLLILSACGQPPQRQSIEEDHAPEPLSIMLDAESRRAGVDLMLDDSRVSAFQPCEMMVYGMLLPSAPKVDSIVFSPVRRRGYSDSFRILARCGDDLVTAKDFTIALNGNPLPRISLMVIGTCDAGMMHRRYYRDTIPYSIDIQDTDAAQLMAISDMRLYSGGSVISDNCILIHPSEDDAACSLPKAFAQKLASRIDGSLVGRKIRYHSPDGECIAKFFASGKSTFYMSDGNWIHGNVMEDESQRRSIEIVDGTLKAGKASLYINGNQITVPAIKADMYYDALDRDFVNLRSFPDLFQFDIRYATSNNFTHTVLYQQPICHLRYAAARDLIAAARQIRRTNGLMIKMFDGYRPYPVQQIMWDVCPNPNFLSPPSKGSIHNRGGAVDLTLCSPDGTDLDMGTEYDFCGPAAYTTNTNLPDTVLRNRQLLFDLMAQYHFNKIRTEWWHFSHSTARAFELCSFWPED